MENFSQFFKDPLYQDDDIVAIGGDFSTERLLYAYTHGIFPWSESPIRWYSPNPRAVFDINGLHISKTIKKKIKKKSIVLHLINHLKKLCWVVPIELMN
jgi:leucyl/phenylalanyl-tRNA--protein transferase